MKRPSLALVEDFEARKLAHLAGDDFAAAVETPCRSLRRRLAAAHRMNP